MYLIIMMKGSSHQRVQQQPKPKHYNIQSACGKVLAVHFFVKGAGELTNPNPPIAA